MFRYNAGSRSFAQLRAAQRRAQRAAGPKAQPRNWRQDIVSTEPAANAPLNPATEFTSINDVG